MPGATGRNAAVSLPQSGLTANTVDPFDHGYQVAETRRHQPCDKWPGSGRPLRTVASAEIPAFRQTQVPVAKSFNAPPTFFTIRPPMPVVLRLESSSFGPYGRSGGGSR